MSVQTAFPAPDLSHRSSSPLQPPKRRRRVVRAFGFGMLLLLLALLVSGAVLFFSPPVLEAMSAMALKPQTGTIPWNGRDRITVVAMGLTQRTTEPARTDTLLAMDIDPPKHRINMLSIPRDLWVNIPGYGQGKLAIAYEVGGPKLAAYTLERELGVPVDYTIALTFGSFTKIVDALGGVTVNVPQELKDSTYPCLIGYDFCPIDIKPGKQHMDGATALEFVRERHALAQQDLNRVQDQQAFTDALKHKLMSPTTLPRYPAVFHALTNSLITNMPLNDLPEVGVQYMMPFNHVNHSYINIDNGMVKTDWSQDGQSILVPTSSNVIPNLVHNLFADTALSQENASVAVLNGTGTPGAASDVEATLQSLGFHTVMAGNADTSSYHRALVIINTAISGPADYTARRLQRLMNADLVRERLPAQSAHIVLIAGSESPGL